MMRLCVKKNNYIQKKKLYDIIGVHTHNGDTFRLLTTRSNSRGCTSILRKSWKKILTFNNTVMSNLNGDT